jgi:hypothetical protein
MEFLDRDASVGCCCRIDLWQATAADMVADATNQTAVQIDAILCTWQLITSCGSHALLVAIFASCTTCIADQQYTDVGLAAVNGACSRTEHHIPDYISLQQQQQLLLLLLP